MNKNNLNFFSEAARNLEEFQLPATENEEPQPNSFKAMPGDALISEDARLAKSVIAKPKTILRIKPDKKEAIDNKFDGMISDMLKAFNDTMGKTRNNYYLNIGISIVIVLFGISLVSITIYRGITNQSFDVFSAVPASLGIASFVALFFVSPQTKNRKILGDLAQMQIIYTNWSEQAYSSYQRLALSGFTGEAIVTFQTALAAASKDAVDSIEKNIGNDSEPTSTDNTTSKS